LLVAEQLIEQETLSAPKAARYRGWDVGLGNGILGGDETLESLAAKVEAGEIDPKPVSGRQEALENEVNRVIWNLGG
jgi:xylose isomerase